MPNLQRNVLVIDGDLEGVLAWTMALLHPALIVTAAGDEPRIVAAVTDHAFDLVVIGGTVRGRDPLKVAESVRVRQASPLLVIVGRETPSQALEEHRLRGFPQLEYLDARRLGDGRGRPTLGVARRVRASCLELLGLPEDPITGFRWVENLKGREIAAAVKSEAAATAATNAEVAAMHDDDAYARPPILAAPTEADLSFARELGARLRDVDFRGVATAFTPVAGDPTDVKVTKLRDVVSGLARQLARLAFVYTARDAAFTSVEQRLAAKQREVGKRDTSLATIRAQLTALSEELSLAVDHGRQLSADIEAASQGNARFVLSAQHAEAAQDAQLSHARARADKAEQLLETLQRTTELDRQRLEAISIEAERDRERTASAELAVAAAVVEVNAVVLEGPVLPPRWSRARAARATASLWFADARQRLATWRSTTSARLQPRLTAWYGQRRRIILAGAALLIVAGASAIIAPAAATSSETPLSVTELTIGEVLVPNASMSPELVSSWVSPWPEGFSSDGEAQSVPASE